MKFTLRQLRYFIAAGEAGSITTAAERCNISQPSVSTAISSLERDLKVQLFDRHRAQGLSLTAEGRVLLGEARQLIQRTEELSKSLTQRETLATTITVGCIVTLAPMVMPELTLSFTRAVPSTTLHQHESHQEGLLESLRRAEIDIAITYDLELSSDIAFTPLIALPPYALFGESDPLHKQPTVGLKDLADRPMVLLDLPISRDYFASLFSRERLKPLVQWRSTQQDAVRTMVANGFGYALFNARPRAKVALDGKRLFPVALAGSHRPVVMGLATYKQLKKSRLVRLFESHCRAAVSDGYVPGMRVHSIP